MRTTINLPEKLLEKAMNKTKIKLKRALIIKALEDMIRKSDIKNSKTTKAKLILILIYHPCGSANEFLELQHFKVGVSSDIGIPDLIIAQNCFDQHSALITKEKHFSQLQQFL